MAAKYITNAAGVLQEVAAATDGGGANANKIPELDSNGRLTAAMMPAGIGSDVGTVNATENLAAGDFVNIYDNAATPGVRKADASAAGKEAHGFVLSAVTSGNPATVYFEGVNDQVTGMTAGKVFLSAATGNAVQRLGVAVSATEINFEASQPIILA